ncbi:hypothetical protein RFI_00583 [Reticulomyxa filosa]|uniref:CCHC-type domain-containing protein n=1 Tax=Reticulomyxa filosa TaxID=46433 RepID=X6PEL7_RETFI|nr:hypothetical protein RFI_00583 [Reticulomyxa filosa]|eukprot:ETO36479.1 hypothetical protein RFI_00583 [Reticulomyxa filosa]
MLAPDLIPHRSAAFLNNHGLNRHWICEGLDNPRHIMPRYFLSNLMEAQFLCGPFGCLLNKNALSRKVLAHTFSENFQTLFIHFAVDVNEQQLMQLAQNFNNIKNGQIEKKENNDGKQRIIGYSMVKVGLFDKNKSRPKSHFKQCRNCYRLNHIARECPKKRKVCKYFILKKIFFYVIKNLFTKTFRYLILRFCARSDIYKIITLKMNSRLTRKNDEQN